MKKTVGSTDKIIRVLLAIAIGYFAYSTSFEAIWIQIVLYVVAIVLLVTSLSGFCPFYSACKLSTNKKE